MIADSVAICISLMLSNFIRNGEVEGKSHIDFIVLLAICIAMYLIYNAIFMPNIDFLSRGVFRELKITLNINLGLFLQGESLPCHAQAALYSGFV